MNNLAIYLEKLRVFLNDLIVKVEESPLFERLVLKYESLEPKQQRWVRNGGTLAFFSVIGLVFFLPLILALQSKSQVSSMRKLLFEVQSFNNENSIVRRPAPRPRDWRALPAGTLQDLESSLQNFSETIGIPSDFVAVKGAGNGLSIDIQELSLRQAVALLYQIDGWFPAVKFDENKISIHPDSKDLLTLRAQLSYDETLAAQLPQDAGAASFGRGGRGRSLPLDDDDGYGAGAAAYPGGESSGALPSPPGYPAGGGLSPSDEFGGDALPPPSLNFEEDL
jgi:hypothetical protein